MVENQFYYRVLFVLETVVERVRVTVAERLRVIVVDLLREGLTVADRVKGLVLGMPERLRVRLLVTETDTERVKGLVVGIAVLERVKGLVLGMAERLLLIVPERVKA